MAAKKTSAKRATKSTATKKPRAAKGAAKAKSAAAPEAKAYASIAAFVKAGKEGELPRGTKTTIARGTDGRLSISASCYHKGTFQGVVLSSAEVTTDALQALLKAGGIVADISK